MRDKSVAEMAGILFPVADEIIVTAPRQARAVRPESMLEMAEHSRIRPVPALREAIEFARRNAAPEDVVFITGSLFLVGEAKAW
jgi:dihydrofolate synthase/folylpolyglutamate synthase